MDIAHKKMLEEMTNEQVINICLEQEDTIKGYQTELARLNEIIQAKQFLIDTLLKVIKYQNGLNDKEEK